MIEIIPAIMPESFNDLRSKMNEVKDFVSFVQIDVMDGFFVPSKSWPYETDGFDSDFEEIVSGKKEMPFLGEIEFEVDLMVSDQEEEVVRWIQAGAGRVIGHVEAVDDIERFIKTALDANVPKDSFLSVDVGLAIGLETPVDVLKPYISDIDFVQFMGIEKIGYQGEEFSEKVLSKISTLRKNFPDLIISVDGGVNEDSASLLIDAGVDRLVSGSEIFGASDKGEIIKKLSSS
jgi:ribulose-phosphate 3-epimerase